MTSPGSCCVHAASWWWFCLKRSWGAQSSAGAARDPSCKGRVPPQVLPQSLAAPCCAPEGAHSRGLPSPCAMSTRARLCSGSLRLLICTEESRNPTSALGRSPKNSPLGVSL